MSDLGGNSQPASCKPLAVPKTVKTGSLPDPAQQGDHDPRYTHQPQVPEDHHQLV